jgi:hypothetical protein
MHETALLWAEERMRRRPEGQHRTGPLSVAELLTLSHGREEVSN